MISLGLLLMALSIGLAWLGNKRMSAVLTGIQKAGNRRKKDRG
jgi:hypothetical protein